MLQHYEYGGRSSSSSNNNSVLVVVIIIIAIIANVFFDPCGIGTPVSP
jgi:hypothetical protein